jgi:hypothetical protein
MRHIGSPFRRIITEIVIADARKPIERFSAGVRVCALKGQHDRRFASVDYSLGWAEEQMARLEVGAVRLEPERQSYQPRV